METLALSRPDGSVCNKNGGKPTHRMPLVYKRRQGQELMQKLHEDKLDHDVVAAFICSIDVSGLSKKLVDTFNTTFDEELASKENALFSNRKGNFNTFKAGTSQTMLIFSDRVAQNTIHFPYLKEWLPLVQKEVLGPLGIPLKNICRMQLTLMPYQTVIKRHPDVGPWVHRCHRTHIPLMSNGEVYFITIHPHQEAHYRIPSEVGRVFEVNNAIPHTVKNFGSDRVHLIVDWAEEELNVMKELEKGESCDYNGNSGIVCHGTQG